MVFSELLDTALHIAFLPEAGALAVGGAYTAELDGVAPLEDILVGPAITWSDPLTLSESIFEVDHPTGEPQCCPAPVDSCGNTPCFRTQIERRTTVSLRWDEDLSIEAFQYVFRLGRDAIDPATPWSWNAPGVQFELDPAEDSACYVLELKRLVDDSVQTFSRCIEQPAGFTPGLHMTPKKDVKALLEECDEPPDGHEEIWCEARLPPCESRPDDAWCADLHARCAMPGSGGAAGASNIAGDGGTSGGGDIAGGGGEAGASGGTAGSSAVQGGVGGTSETGGAPSLPAGAGGTADAGAPDADAGDGAGEGKRVVTKACGCALPGHGSRDPTAVALALALAAATITRRRATPRAFRPERGVS